MSHKYINEREAAEAAVRELLAQSILAFDIETQPHFPYPRKRTKTEYAAYFRFLQYNRWGLRYAYEPEDIADPQSDIPAPVEPREETARIERMMAPLRAKNTKTAQKYIDDLTEVIAALRHPLVPAWVMRHVAGLLARGEVDNDPVRPGLDPRTSRVFLVQFATEDGRACCFNALRVGLDVFIPIFERVPLVGANLTFDVQFVVHATGIFPKIAWDVTVADRVLTLGLEVPHHLQDITQRWTGETLDKSVRASFAEPHVLEPSPEQIEYALKDVTVLFPIMHNQRAAAEAFQMLDAVRLFIDLTNPTAAIEYCGLKIDTKRWLELAEESEKRLRAAAEEFAAYLGIEPEELTKRELVKAAAKMRGIELETLNKQDLAEVERGYENDPDKAQFFNLYRAWSHWQKRVATYGRSFLSHIHPLTGRIHPNLKIAGTETGRYASNEPNILNLPRGEDGDLDFRSAFVAPDGYVFGNADYAAMEQRIAADLSGDPALLALFGAGGDNHSVTAALMFHTRRGDVDKPQPTTFEFQHKQIEGYVTPKDWDAQQLVRFIIESGLAGVISKKYKKTTRQTAKIVAFLYFYGGTAVGLAKKLHCTVDAAEQFFRDFQAAYPALTRWFANNGKLPFQNNVARKDGTRAGYASTYAGLRRWFALPRPAKTREEEKQAFRKRAAITRQAMNFPCQGGNAVVMAQAIVDFWRTGEPRLGEIEAMSGIERMVVAPIYDEVLVLLPETATEEEAKQSISEVMEAAANRYMTRCRAAADPNPLSKNWRKF